MTDGDDADRRRGPFHIALSPGIAEAEETIPNIGTLLDYADFPLYHAGQSGRNRAALFRK